MNRFQSILIFITDIFLPVFFASADDTLLHELLLVGLPVVEIETVNGEMPTAEPIAPPQVVLAAASPMPPRFQDEYVYGSLVVS